MIEEAIVWMIGSKGSSGLFRRRGCPWRCWSMDRHVEERSRWELHGNPVLTRPRTRRRSSQDARDGVTNNALESRSEAMVFARRGCHRVPEPANTRPRANRCGRKTAGSVRYAVAPAPLAQLDRAMHS